MKRLICAAALLATAVGTWAGEKGDGGYMIWSARPCGEYIRDRQASGYQYAADEYWVSGYVTAYNLLVPDTADILGNTSMESAMLWLENYCKAHPLENLAAGMLSLTGQLYPNRHHTRKETGR